MLDQYSILGPFCRANVRHYDTGAVLTGHLAGEPVSRTFHEHDSESYVFAFARALAFDGVWPRNVSTQTGTTRLGLQPVIAQRRAA
jgi:hypothetical protein